MNNLERLRLRRPPVTAAPSPRLVTPVVAILAVAAFVALPLAGTSPSPDPAGYAQVAGNKQNLMITSLATNLNREEFGVSGGWGSAPAAGNFDAGTSQAIAQDLVLDRGWDASEFSCLVALWNKESQWNHGALNPSSGAYGIPQALPGDKMASAGADWATNPATQIRWGLGYIDARYGSPCAAWGHSQQKNWY